MIGTTREEIEQLNKMDLIGYLLSTDRNSYRVRKNGTIVHKQKDNFVIWHDHSYDFGTTVHPFKDNIGTIREIYGYSFMDAVNRLRDYRDKQEQLTEEKQEIPSYNLFL